MFGDDPDTTVMTAWVESGTILGRAREEGRGLTREVRLGLAVVVDCEEGLRLRKEKRETRRLFPETENVRR